MLEQLSSELLPPEQRTGILGALSTWGGDGERVLRALDRLWDLCGARSPE